MSDVLEPPPFTPVDPVTEVLHGVEIADPYRWLEGQNSPYTRGYFDAIPRRDHIRKRVEEFLTAKDVISEPWNVSDRYFFLKRQEGSEQPVIVMRNGLFEGDKVLVDTG